MEEVEALLSVGESDTPMSLRDRAIIEVMYATGVRVSELVSLDIDDVDLDEGFVRCMGKGSKERIIPLHDEAIGTVREYLADSRPSLAGAAAGRALFRQPEGRSAHSAGPLAHSEGTRTGGGYREEDYSAHAAAQLRDASSDWGSAAATRAGATRSTRASRRRRCTLI